MSSSALQERGLGQETHGLYKAQQGGARPRCEPRWVWLRAWLIAGLQEEGLHPEAVASHILGCPTQLLSLEPLSREKPRPDSDLAGPGVSHLGKESFFKEGSRIT
jgi:hypothetical protein